MHQQCSRHREWGLTTPSRWSTSPEVTCEDSIAPTLLTHQWSIRPQRASAAYEEHRPIADRRHHTHPDESRLDGNPIGPTTGYAPMRSASACSRRVRFTPMRQNVLIYAASSDETLDVDAFALSVQYYLTVVTDSVSVQLFFGRTSESSRSR
jgi:hypothetical protein